MRLKLLFERTNYYSVYIKVRNIIELRTDVSVFFAFFIIITDQCRTYVHANNWILEYIQQTKQHTKQPPEVRPSCIQAPASEVEVRPP